MFYLQGVEIYIYVQPQIQAQIEVVHPPPTQNPYRASKGCAIMPYSLKKPQLQLLAVCLSSTVISSALGKTDPNIHC